MCELQDRFMDKCRHGTQLPNFHESAGTLSSSTTREPTETPKHDAGSSRTPTNRALSCATCPKSLALAHGSRDTTAVQLRGVSSCESQVIRRRRGQEWSCLGRFCASCDHLFRANPLGSIFRMPDANQQDSKSRRHQACYPVW